jgi:hypothetical protein
LINNPYIATLVERQTRYVMLAKVAGKDTRTVVTALIKQAKKLPKELYKSLTWDRGKELTAHRRFTLATNIDVYFCDPQSPWQRGSNENTNGLLRQYFPQGTDLSVHSQAHLNKVARQLLEVRDDVEQINGRLFGFLALRASDSVFRAFVEASPTVFEKVAKSYYYSGYHSKVRLYARAHQLGLLQDEFRDEMVGQLEFDIFDKLDTSILNDEEILSLIRLRQLMALPRRIKEELLPAIEAQMDEIVEKADLDLEPQDNFEEIASSISDLETFFDGDTDGMSALGSVSVSLEAAIERVGEKKRLKNVEQLGTTGIGRSMFHPIQPPGRRGVPRRSLPPHRPPDRCSAMSPIDTKQKRLMGWAAVRSGFSRALRRMLSHQLLRVGVLKTLERRSLRPVVLVHMQNRRFLKGKTHSTLTSVRDDEWTDKCLLMHLACSDVRDCIIFHVNDNPSSHR